MANINIYGTLINDSKEPICRADQVIDPATGKYMSELLEDPDQHECITEDEIAQIISGEISASGSNVVRLSRQSGNAVECTVGIGLYIEPGVGTHSLDVLVIFAPSLKKGCNIEVLDLNSSDGIISFAMVEDGIITGSANVNYPKNDLIIESGIFGYNNIFRIVSSESEYNELREKYYLDEYTQDSSYPKKKLSIEGYLPKDMIPDQ